MNPPGAALNVLDSLPDGFAGWSIRDLADLLPGPTLIHVEGRRKDPVFLSILLHGNETVGFEALQKILDAYRAGLPRSLSVFLGNIAAAARGSRRLEGQPDYNRIWPSPGVPPATPEHHLMIRVVEEMRRRQPFVSIDLHNNSGLNPHYACVNMLDHRFLHLASLFSRTVVYFLRPQGVQSMAFAQLCPSVTLECGRVGDASGVAHAAEFLDACLHLERLPERPVNREDIQLFHTVATVKVPEGTRFGFGDGSADIDFVEDLEYYNFRELPAGTVIARYPREGRPVLEVLDENGESVGRKYLRYDLGVIRLAARIMPAMLTLNEDIIRQDCLCYFMERYPLPAPH